jgi:hypothetical protein
MGIDARIPLYLTGWYLMKEGVRIARELEVQDQEVRKATPGPLLAPAGQLMLTKQSLRTVDWHTTQEALDMVHVTD